MQIISTSYFDKQNVLYIPLAMADPNSVPSQESDLQATCKRVEEEVLVNALQLPLYNALQTAFDNLEDPLNLRFKKLVNGEQYDDKIWKGLDYEYSLIAQRVYEIFNTENNIRLSAIGAVKANPENANLATPVYLIANANQQFIKQYQGEYRLEPILYGEHFIDWYFHTEPVFKSLLGYLQDKKLDFPEWDIMKFRPYQKKNSFGI